MAIKDEEKLNHVDPDEKLLPVFIPEELLGSLLRIRQEIQKKRENIITECSRIDRILKLLTFSGGILGTRESHPVSISQGFPTKSLKTWCKEVKTLEDEFYLGNNAEGTRGTRSALFLSQKSISELLTFATQNKEQVPELGEYLSRRSHYKQEFSELEAHEE